MKRTVASTTRGPLTSSESLWSAPSMMSHSFGPPAASYNMRLWAAGIVASLDPATASNGAPTSLIRSKDGYWSHNRRPAGRKG